LSLHNIESCHFISFLLHEGWHIWSCFDIDSLGIVTYSTSHSIITKSLYILIQKRMTLSDIWFFIVPWFLGLNIHVPFSITFGTSTLRLPLALLRCMIHRGHVLVNPSSTIILYHTSLYVFHTLILWKPFSYDQVDSIDIHYLEITLDQFFLG
jgi:hypothetical protein